MLCFVPMAQKISTEVFLTTKRFTLKNYIPHAKDKKVFKKKVFNGTVFKLYSQALLTNFAHAWHHAHFCFLPDFQ